MTLPQRREALLTRRKKALQTDIPYHEIESLARCLLPDIQVYFESEEGKCEYAEWKEHQAKLKQPRKEVEDNDST